MSKAMAQNNSSVLCVLNPIPSLYSEIAVTFIMLPINSFLLFCFIIGRSKLKSRQVSKYCCNVVVAAVAASIARLIDTMTRLNSDPWMPRSFQSGDDVWRQLYYWRLTEKSSIIYMFLVVIGTFFLVTLALRDNLLGVSATVAGVSRPKMSEDVEKQMRRSRLCKIIGRERKKNTTLLIFLNWLLPLLVVVVGITTYDCLEGYVCPFEFVPSNSSLKNAQRGCSPDMPPIPTQAIDGATVCWVTTLVFLVAAQASCFISYRRIRCQVALKHKDSVEEGHVPEGGQSEAVASKLTSEQNENLMLTKIRSDLMTIVIVSVVYTVVTFGSGVIAILANVYEWNLTREERYYTILFVNLPILAETFGSCYLCYNIYPVNTAVSFTVGSILKKLACCCKSR